MGYEVYSAASPVRLGAVGSSTTTYTVSGLIPRTTYQFAVIAYNDSVSGPAATVTITTPPIQHSQTITFPPPPDTAVGHQVTLTASASSGLQVAFSTGTGGVCTVSGSVVSTVAPGTCTVTASQDGDTDYARAPGVTQSFHVTPIQASPTHARHHAQTIEFTQPPGTNVGRPVKLSASASSGLPVTFSSDTPRVCTVSGPAVTITAPGACTVTASQDGNAYYGAARPVTRSFVVDAVTPIKAKAAGPPTLVIALAAAIVAIAGVAGTVLVRRHRLRSRRPLQPSIRAEPHAGTPGRVSVHATGTDRTQTVRIEPDPGTGSVRTRKVSP